MPIINGVYVAPQFDKPTPTGIKLGGPLGMVGGMVNMASSARNQQIEAQKAEREKRSQEEVEMRKGLIASAKQRLSEPDTTQTPRPSVQDRIKEIEARQAAMNPQQRRQDLLARVDRMEKEGEESRIRSAEETRRRNEESAERMRTNPNIDPETRIGEVRRLERSGVYVFPDQKERAEARQELGIIAVGQGNQPTQLQDLRRAGRPGLMTPQEIADAGTRLDTYHQRIKEINRKNRALGRPTITPPQQRGRPTITPPQQRGRAPQMENQNLNRELVESYKEQLSENIVLRGLAAGAKAVRDFFVSPKGLIPKVTDPIVRRLTRGRSPKTVRSVRRGARAAGRAAVGAGIGYAAGSTVLGGGDFDAGELGARSLPDQSNMPTRGGGRGQSRRRYEANIDVIRDLADTAGQSEMEIEQLAGMHSGGAGVNYRNRTIGLQRSLAYNLAKRRGDREAMGALKSRESPLIPVERRGRSNTSIGSGVGGKPILVGGSYVDPNSPQGRINAEIAARPENVAARQAAKAAEDTEYAERVRKAKAKLDASRTPSLAQVLGNLGKAMTSPLPSQTSIPPATGQTSVPVTPRPSTGAPLPNDERPTYGPPKVNVPKR